MLKIQLWVLRISEGYEKALRKWWIVLISVTALLRGKKMFVLLSWSISLNWVSFLLEPCTHPCLSLGCSELYLEIQQEAHHRAAVTLLCFVNLTLHFFLHHLSAFHIQHRALSSPASPLSTTSLVVALQCGGSLLKFSGWKKHLLVTLNLVSAALVLTETSQPCGKGTDVVFGKLELTPFLYQGPPLWPWVNHKRLNLKAPFGAQPPHTDFQHPGCSASGAAPLDFHPHSLFLQDTTPTLSRSCTATPTVQPQGNIYQSPPSTKHWEGRCVERCCFYTFSIEEEGTFPPHVLSFQHFFLPNSSVSPSETFP